MQDLQQEVCLAQVAVFAGEVLLMARGCGEGWAGDQLAVHPGTEALNSLAFSLIKKCLTNLSSAIRTVFPAVSQTNTHITK